MKIQLEIFKKFFELLSPRFSNLDSWSLNPWFLKVLRIENWFETVNLHVLLTDTVHVNLILVSICTHILGREDNCENIQPDIMKCRPISEKTKSQVFLCPSLSLCFRSQWVFYHNGCCISFCLFFLSAHILSIIQLFLTFLTPLHMVLIVGLLSTVFKELCMQGCMVHAIVFCNIYLLIMLSSNYCRLPGTTTRRCSTIAGH